MSAVSIVHNISRFLFILLVFTHKPSILLNLQEYIVDLQESLGYLDNGLSPPVTVLYLWHHPFNTSFHNAIISPYAGDSRLRFGYYLIRILFTFLTRKCRYFTRLLIYALSF